MTTRLQKCLISIAVCALTIAYVGPAGAASVNWHGLKRVTVTVTHPGVLHAKPRTKRFTTAPQLKKVTNALNKKHISKRAKPVRNTGCAGGFDIKIAILRGNGKRVELTGYLCGGKAYGKIGGNVRGFLKAIKLST